MSIPKFALTMGVMALMPVSAWSQSAGGPAGAAAGQSSGQAPVVYRCPGPPVLYTDTLSPQEARSKNCRPLTDLPIALAPPAPRAAPAPVPATPSAPAAGGAAPGATSAGATGAPLAAAAAAATTAAVPQAAASPAAPMPDARVRPDDQRSRDAEARRILEAELRREEARLSEAVKASGTAKPGERVGADAAQIRRAESDIEAIRRELGRLR